MRHVLNLFASQLKRDTEAGLYNKTDWNYYMAFLGVHRRNGNNTPWTNVDDSSFDYGDPMGQAGRWPWCRNAPDGENIKKTVVRIGPFNSNESAPFEDPRNYGCWHDADGDYKAPYAICKKNVTGNATGSSRFFYYEPDVSPTQPPSSTTIVTGRLSRYAPAESSEDEAIATELRRQRHPDRHA